MCLCNGTGSVGIKRDWGLEFAPCPDTNCQFDRAAADREYEVWKAKIEQCHRRESA